MPAAVQPSIGKPLPDHLKRDMEKSFGADFSNIRVHEDSNPSHLGALAYTQGSQIHFPPGGYDPNSLTGRQLIGHELAHTVQQQSGQVTTPQDRGLPINDSTVLESEADRLGASAAQGHTLQLPPAYPTGQHGESGGSIAPIQRAINVGGDNEYRGQVRAHLQHLAAPGTNVHIGANGNVTLHGEAEDEELPASHRLLARMIDHQHTATLRPREGNEEIQAEPVNPRGNLRAVGDFFGDIASWEPWGTTRRLRDRASAGTGGQGASSSIPFDPALPEAQRMTPTLHPESGEVQNQPAPLHVQLAHELIHADHFQRGTGAFKEQGRMLEGIEQSGEGAGQVQRRQFLEEMNTVGLPSAQEPGAEFTQPHANPLAALAGEGPQQVPAFTDNPLYRSHADRAVDPAAITENDIRAQLGLRRRPRYN